MLYLENAKKSFASAVGVTPISVDRNDPESSFYHNFSRMIPDKIDVDTLVLAFKMAFQDAMRNGENILPYISLVPNYVRQFASLEFAHEFRKKYIQEVLGLDQQLLSDVDYGYKEVEPGVIDISDKDRAEVLAALYNASTPIGMGFSEYNPMPWTKEIAEMYFEQFGQPDEHGAIRFKYILGRPIKCTFIDNLVYVRGYNYDNEFGLAQRAIATCKNKTLKKEKI